MYADLSVDVVYLRCRQSLSSFGFALLSITPQRVAENEPSTRVSQKQFSGWVQFCNAGV